MEFTTRDPDADTCQAADCDVSEKLARYGTDEGHDRILCPGCALAFCAGAEL